MYHLLLIEDDPSIAEIIEFYLRKNNEYTVTWVTGAEKAFEVLQGQVDMILLDIMLPEANGIDLCAQLRKITYCPIIFISCLDQEETIIRALRMGGDDYLVKPFSCSVLLARMETHIRRLKLDRLQAKEELEIGGIRLDTRSHSVTKNGVPVELSPTELQFLLYLMKNPGWALEQEEMYQAVWHRPSLGDLRTISVHISNLRKKIEDDPANPRLLRTVRGIGYLFDDGAGR